MSRQLRLDLLVFGLALAVRLAFLFGADEPLRYPFHFHTGLKIAQHASPVAYVLKSDDWRGWGQAGSGGWTVAPLYYVFEAAVVGLFGPHLRPLLVVQCVLAALTAVGVSRLGVLLAGPIGVVAGLAYTVHWQAVVFHAGADTENVHTVLLVWALVLLAGMAPAAGGFVLGVSALARGVSLAFVPLAGLWLWRAVGGERGLRRAAVLVGCSVLAVLPWTLRNRFLLGEFVPIETTSIFNLWNDNAFVDEGRWGRQARLIDKQPTVAGKRSEALRFAIAGWQRAPGTAARKIVDNLEYMLRPDELRATFVAELPRPLWQASVGLLLGDLLFALAVALALAYALGGEPAPARGLLLLWLAYYLFMLVVVFHTQVRYRTAFTPVLFACAAAGWAALRAGAEERRPRLLAGLALGVGLVAWASAFELRAAARGLASMPSLFRARAAVVDGDLQRAAEDVGRAVSRDPQSARPHVSAGRWLLHTGHTDGAIGEYQRARETKPYVWLPRLVLPRLLADAGRTEEAQQALLEAHALSRSDDPWLALEAAWRELPPPRADEIVLGGLDYGAVRGFMAPESGRWSRRQAWLRLRPLRAAARHAVTLRMGSPEPSPFDAPRVEVRVGRGPWTALTLERGLRDHRLEASAGGDGVILVELRAPVWSLVGKPPELGVFVERLSVAPLG